MPRRSVLVIRSRELGWQELGAALWERDDVKVVGEPLCADRGRALAERHRPDLIFSATRVNEVLMPRVLIDLQRGPCADAKIVLFSGSIEPDVVFATDDLRLAGWLIWHDLSTDGLRHALTAVCSGEFLVGSRPVVDALFSARCHPSAAREPALSLATREYAVLRHLAEGATRQEIAAEEGISPRTADRIVSGLEAKLHVPTRTALIAKAYRLGLLL